MTDEKWLDTIGNIKDKFGVLEEGKEELSEEEGRGHLEFIVFNGPMGKMRLERSVKPVVTGKKTLSSRRIGSGATVEYIYSDTETFSKFKAYKWDEGAGDWMEISAFGL